MVILPVEDFLCGFVQDLYLSFPLEMEVCFTVVVCLSSWQCLLGYPSPETKTFLFLSHTCSILTQAPILGEALRQHHNSNLKKKRKKKKEKMIDKLIDVLYRLCMSAG